MDFVGFFAFLYFWLIKAGVCTVLKTALTYSAKPVILHEYISINIILDYPMVGNTPQLVGKRCSRSSLK